MRGTDLQRVVEALATPSGRAVGTRGHDVARKYITENLRAVGLVPYRGGSFELPYSAQGVAFTNIAACVPGAEPDRLPLLVHAHYDTCGEQPGADDNAAAIAIALQVAECLCAAPLRRTVVFSFPDAEEPPTTLPRRWGRPIFIKASA